MLLLSDVAPGRRFLARRCGTLTHAIALVFASGALSVSETQEQAVAFVHGLFSSGGVWQQTATALETEFAIQPILPTLGWQNAFFNQASNLHNSIGGTNGIAAVAHSNGGLVLRKYLRGFGSISRINRGVTVGTPHGGAALAGHALNGNLVQFSDLFFTSIADPINFYYAADPEFREAFDTAPLGVFRHLAQFMAGMRVRSTSS